MPYAAGTTATCHPDRQKKTSAGECEDCYKKRRYHEDEDIRRRKIAATRRWYQENSSTPAVRAWKQRSNRRRRALRAAAESEPYTLAEIGDRDGWRCGICGKRVGRAYGRNHPRSATVDHIVALASGGSDLRANVQLAHRSCNGRKAHTGPGQLRIIG